MSSLIAPSLIRYQKVIKGLTPYSGHSQLDILVERACLQYYPSATKSVFPSIIEEIKRLSKPCERILDLRDYFDNCKEFLHNDIIHHLDEIAENSLIDEIEKHNNTLTLMTYQSVLSLAKERYLEENMTLPEKKTNKETIKVEERPLINTTFCKSEPLNYSSETFAFLSDNYNSSPPHHLERAIDEAVPVSVIRVGHGLIRIKTHTTDLNPKLLYFKNHHPKINTDNTIPDFSLSVDIAKSTTQPDGAIFIDLKINTQLTLSNIKEIFPHYIEARIKANNLNLHEQFDPLKQSILAKSHKQWWNSVRSTYALLAEVREGAILQSQLLRNKKHDHVIDFMSQGNKVGFDTLSNECIKLSSKSNVVDKGLIGVSFLDGCYYIETRKEFLMTRLWRESIRNGDGYIFSFTLSPIKHADELCYSPSALPSHIGPEFAILNHKATDSVKNTLEGINYLFQFSELNSLIEQFPKEDRVDSYLNFIKKTALKSHGTTSAIILDNTLTDDFRIEDRFPCELPVIIESKSKGSKRYASITENISAKGLKIKTLPPFPDFSPGEDILVSLTLEFGKRKYILKRQPYKIIGTNKNELRLIYEGVAGSRFMADKVISQYIYYHFNALMDSKEDKYSTLSFLPENLLAQKITDVPFFVKRTRDKWFPSAISLTPHSFSENPHNDNFLSVEKLLSSPKVADIYLKALNSSSKNEAIIVYIAVSFGDEIAAREIKELTADSCLYSVLHKMKHSRRCRVLKFSMNKTPILKRKPFHAEFEQLLKINKSLGEEVGEHLKSTVGVGIIEDVTSSSWCLLDTHNKMN